MALGLGGLASGCLTALGPNIRARNHHQDVRASDDDGECLTCHEPELSAQARLMKMGHVERDAAMDRMMGGGGASLVAQWMIDDSRSCQQCHVLRGGAH